MTSQCSSYMLAQVLVDLFQAERSGVLILARDDAERRVQLDRGMIVYAQSPAPDEDLGAVLVGEGRVSAGALAEAKRSLAGGAEPAALAAALVQRDLIARSAVCDAMSVIVRRVLQSAFAWDEAQASFVEAPAPSTLFVPNILSTVGVILDGVFAMSRFELVREPLRGVDNRIHLCRPSPIPLEQLTLSALHGFILSRIDGTTTVRELLAILPPEEEDMAARFVFGMLILGVLAFDPPLGEGPFRATSLVRLHANQQAAERVHEQMIRQKYELIRSQSPSEVLGVRHSASRVEIERAYEELKAQYGRERISPRVMEKLRAELTLIESRLVESFLALTQPAAAAVRARASAAATAGPVTARDLNVRVELDKTKVKLELDNAARVADGYFAKGIQCVKAGDFHNAIQYGKLAISHNPSDARYFCLVADCQARNKEVRWQRLAEENYRRATELDPWNPEYWLSLGRLYKRGNMRERARRSFEAALRLLPNKPEILAELRSLEA